MARSRRSGRGFTLIEGIVASVIMAVAVMAMFGAWSTTFITDREVSETTSAAEVAQAELEIAKVFGAANFPTGTYNSSTSTGSWTGAYLTSTGWTQNALAYYNFNGVQVASATASGAFFSVSLTTTDTDVLAGTGTSYTIQATSNRALVVTITNISTGNVDYTMATNLVEGGL